MIFMTILLAIAAFINANTMKGSLALFLYQFLQKQDFF